MTMENNENENKASENKPNENPVKEKTEEEKKREEEAKKIIVAVHNRSLQMLQGDFDAYKVEGQIINHPNFGPMFVYRLKENEGDKEYACGFFMNEMLKKHQEAGRAGQWLASFYIDMIAEGVSRPLLKPPSNKEEAKKVLDEHIVPHCARSVQEEFGTEAKVGFNMHKQAGPVLEAGFPHLKDGNNACAMPLQFLLTLHLMNRDPSEPLINGLYKIQEEYEAKQQA
ncbi:hypothetical protein [Paenibacillus sp. 1P07SE]|uniref:hypothetical protein n=1 Tax=Paenibacillus sp. 1P07SE TaxID=3132209 RepID=UPI0039A60168